MTKQQEALYSSAVAIILVLTGFFSVGAFAASSLQLETLKTHSRLAISLDPSVEAEWQEVDGGFNLLLRGVALQDLYLGGADLQRLRDSRISSVKVSESDNGVTISGKWKFAEGANAVLNPKMERFTYREKDPARFVVDFWPKGGVSLVEVKKQQKDEARKATIAKAEKEAEKRKVEIRTYSIIYELIEDIEAAVKGMLKPKFEEQFIG